MDAASGGPPQGIRNLLPALQAMGIEQDIVSLDLPDACFLNREGIKIFTLGPGKSSWAFSRKLDRWLRSHLSGYDAVIMHGLWQYPFWAVRREVNRLRKVERAGGAKAPKFYAYPHGMLDPWFQKYPSRRIKALRNEIYWRLIEKHNINAVDVVLFTCEEERRLAGGTFPGYRATEEVVGYGIPQPPERTAVMDEAFRASCPGSVNQPYLLLLSRIHPKKGVDLLIRAYGQMVKIETCGPTSASSSLVPVPPVLVIAGPMESDYARAMQVLAEKVTSECGGRIVFSGMLQGDAKWGALYGAEAFVLPSHQENFGIAVVEALACSTPVLISDKVNIWREIIQGNGGLVANDDEEGVGELMEKWRGLNEEEQKAMREGAQQVYRKYFSVEIAARKLAGFLIV